jgi:hypothetical protein
VRATAETATVLRAALIVYLSLNAVMHSVTLGLQMAHLLPWPTEGTIRVIALGICLVAVACSRYLYCEASRPARNDHRERGCIGWRGRLVRRGRTQPRVIPRLAW